MALKTKNKTGTTYKYVPISERDSWGLAVTACEVTDSAVPYVGKPINLGLISTHSLDKRL